MDDQSPQPELTAFSPDNLYDGDFTRVDPVRINRIPEGLHLYQNVPNPFNPETTIRFDIPENSHVLLSIYNLLGQRVITLLQGNRPAGGYSLTWDGRDQQGRNVVSGIYFVSLVSGNTVQTRKMFLLR